MLTDSETIAHCNYGICSFTLCFCYQCTQCLPWYMYFV